MSETQVSPFAEFLKVPITREEVDTAINDLTSMMEELKDNPVTPWPQAKKLELAIQALSTLS